MVSDFFMEKIYHKLINSPIGFLEITSDETSLISISFVEYEKKASDVQPVVLTETEQQLTDYFTGKRTEFNIKLNPAGTQFQKKVWQEVQKIPFGETKSYLAIALQTGSAKNTRAVGLANGKNPIPIIIPCHRIIGTNGKLTGYAGGLDKKKWLILHELNLSKSKGLLF